MKSPHELRYELSLRPLPDKVTLLFDTLSLPPRLLAHHLLVHDVAARMVEAIQSYWPQVVLDIEAVLIGAAWHDIGKVKYPEELTGSGHQHEAVGLALLQQVNIEQRLARFAVTHGTWSEDHSVQLEDLLVTLADHVWRGKRDTELEQRIADLLAQKSATQRWEVFIAIEHLIAELAEDADQRLNWQRKFPADHQ
jgi:putative nucleotidyltransferase with HDIG domain